ncbi:MAG: glycoside hydrolase family 2, partial [Clostridia bacterium]|nr:glycoside hydrolase family 2 [Clostridia bacterium]
MKWMDFNEHWTCRHLEDEGDGIPVRIPDDAMLREKRTAQALGGLNVGWFEGHDYLYKKHFSLSKAQADMHHVLAFDGVYRCAEVWLNGKKAAFRPYGYTTFTVDCDDFLTEGDNTVEVIARNADQPNSRWYSGAGIYRPVRLGESAKAQYIEPHGVKIRTLSLNPAQVEVTVKTAGEGSVTVEVLDGDR